MTNVAVQGTGLVLVSRRTQTALTYAAAAVFNPLSLSTIAFGVCVGVGYAGAVGALFAVAALIGIAAAATRLSPVRRWLDRQFAERVRQLREAERLTRLRQAGPNRRQQYVDLRDLVDEIEREDPPEAQRFELQELLDHYVGLVVTQQRCIESLRFAGSNELPPAMPLLDPARSTHRRNILERRLRHRDECIRRIERIADEVDAVDELIRLVAQRVACPRLDSDLGREIERRLWELDEVDAALDQLSA